jgi:geranylgeranyl diphosphate/geranylgeranyl-bacteriochlorophyllide a reductase
MQIVVAGGGPAGAICARTLARAGIRTILIEASPNGDKPCAGGLPSILLKRYPLPDLLIKTRNKGVIFQAPSGFQVKADFRDDGVIATVERREFDSHLRWSAEDSGAIMVRGRVLTYEDKGSQLLVQYKGIDGNMRTTEADYLVGADGAYSRIAFQATGKRLPMVIAMQDIIQPVPEKLASLGDMCIFDYSPAVSSDYYGWVFPKGDKVSVGVGTRLKKKDELPGWLDRMKETHEDLLGGGTLLGRFGALIPCGRYQQLGSRRVLLVGDAGGLVLPACGEGIYFAMRSGEIAGEIIRDLGMKRPDILVSRYTDMVNAEFGPIFRYFSKMEKIAYRSAANREVFVRLTEDNYIAQKILSVFSSKHRRRTPIFKKLALSFRILGIRMKVAKLKL